MIAIIRKALLFTLFLHSPMMSQNILKIDSIWVLGKDDKLSLDYIFKQPKQLLIDSKMSFYVHDATKPEIKKYSSSCKLLKKTGRAGEGPGEYRVLYNTLINNYDKTIIAYDIVSKKITLYDLGLNYLKTINVNVPIEPVFISQLTRSSIIMSDYQDVKKNNVLFNIYNNDLSKKIDQFGDLRELLDLNDDYQELNAPHWNICQVDSLKIIATPTWYSNKSYVFYKNKGLWKYYTLFGTKMKQRSYEIITEKEYMSHYNKKGYVMGGRINKKVYAKINGSSVGIFQISNDYIIHLYRENNPDGTYNMYADIFNNSGKLLWNKNVKKYDQDSMPYELLNIDKNDNIYLSERMQGISVISKYKISI